MGRRPKVKMAHAKEPRSEPAISARTPWPAIAAATALAAGCMIHVILAERTYPPNLARFWGIAGGVIVLVGLAAAEVPGRFADFPSRLLRLMLAPGPRTFAGAVAAACFGTSLAFAIYSFERFPTTADEIAQLWHARILLTGRLALPADPNPEFFAIDNMIDQGLWYSEYPIGGPAILAIGTLFGAPWIINPLLCGGTAVALYHFARRIYGEAEARAVAVLFSLTPMVLMIAGSHMNHVPVLFLAVCTLLALAKWDAPASARRRPLTAGAVGLMLGLMATIRPLDAFVVALCVGVFQLAAIARAKERAPDLLYQFAGGLLGSAPLFFANWRTTGHPFRFGYEVLWGKQHGIGLHTDPLGEEHTLRRAVEYAVNYVSELSLFAFMWPIPVLLIVFVVLLAMKRFTRWDALLLGLFTAQVFAYGMYWHDGQFIGPRFLYTVLPTLVVIVARAPFIIGERLGAYWQRVTVAVMLASVAFAWLAPPTQRYTVRGMASVYRNSRAVVKVDVNEVVREAGLQNALVFFRETFGVRVLHRLWGVGMPRSESAVLIRTSDTCSLLEAVRAAERDTSGDESHRLGAIRNAVKPYVHSDSAVRGKDGLTRINSAGEAPRACLDELYEDERRGGAAFGPALRHEPIGPDGRIDGSVIFVADLGERNEVLRARFGTRTWYRFTIARPGDGFDVARIEPY